MKTELVKIIHYDPAKGKGAYSDEKGEIVHFSYQQFHMEQALWPGDSAWLTDGVLYPANVSRIRHWWRKVKPRWL